MEVMRPLREFATPLADISQPMPFTVVQSAFDPFFPRGVLRNYWKSVYLPRAFGRGHRADREKGKRATLAALVCRHIRERRSNGASCR